LLFIDGTLDRYRLSLLAKFNFIGLKVSMLTVHLGSLFLPKNEDKLIAILLFLYNGKLES
jgi:hypothetical protein